MSAPEAWNSQREFAGFDCRTFCARRLADLREFAQLLSDD